MSQHVDGCKLDTDHRGICRDGRDMPRILQPDGKVRSYGRSSSYGKVLEDLNALMGWKCRMTALGLLERPDLLVSAAATRDDKTELQKVVDQAMEAGGATQQSNRGTAVHSLTEVVDNPELRLGSLPDSVAADLAAYEWALNNYGVEPVMMEQFCVQDQLRAAGTFDRTLEVLSQPCPVCEKTQYIGDLKTSSSANYPHSWAIQLAVYAHSELYDYGSQTRSPLDVCQHRAILVHLPAEQAECDLYWIDIVAGWDAATVLVPAVKAWRANKKLLLPLTAA